MQTHGKKGDRIKQEQYIRDRLLVAFWRNRFFAIYLEDGSEHIIDRTYLVFKDRNYVGLRILGKLEETLFVLTSIIDIEHY